MLAFSNNRLEALVCLLPLNWLILSTRERSNEVGEAGADSVWNFDSRLEFARTRSTVLVFYVIS